MIERLSRATGQGGVAVIGVSRVVRRVPLDFDAPLNAVWPGFLLPVAPCPSCGSMDDGAADGVSCSVCEGDEWRHVDPPPTGPGFQLWETTTEGSPISPVFRTLDELCTWSARNQKLFGGIRATAAEWRALLS